MMKTIRNMPKIEWKQFDGIDKGLDSVKRQAGKPGAILAR